MLLEVLGLLGEEVLNHSVVDGIVLGVVVVVLLAILDDVLRNGLVVLGCWGACWPISVSIRAMQTSRTEARRPPLGSVSTLQLPMRP